MQTTNEGNQASKNPKKSYFSKVCYVFFGLTIAFVLVFIFWTNQSNKRLESEFAIPPPSTLDTEDNNTCPVWSLVGDGYCDGEANVPECGYDFNDCCEIENDRSLCQNCTCYISENKIEDYKINNCQDYTRVLNLGGVVIQSNLPNLGDGMCDINRNTEEYFFDIGDCCLDSSSEYSCKHTYSEETFALEYTNCPENLCIKSNNFCIPEELGDGICQDHNNGPFCDYDLGDCCSTNNYYWEISDSKDCCACFCHEHVFYFG